MPHRMTARVVGALFILATVPFSFSVFVLAPILESPDFLTSVAQNRSRVGLGVLLELVNHVAVVGIAVVIYPVLKTFSERLALGYVAARSIEAALFGIATLNLLTLVFVGQEFMAAGGQPAAQFQVLGATLLASHDWNNAALAFISFSIGALTLNYTLLRARARSPLDLSLRSLFSCLHPHRAPLADFRSGTRLVNSGCDGWANLPAGDGIRGVADLQGLQPIGVVGLLARGIAGAPGMIPAPRSVRRETRSHHSPPS